MSSACRWLAELITGAGRIVDWHKAGQDYADTMNEPYFFRVKQTFRRRILDLAFHQAGSREFKKINRVRHFYSSDELL